jgi:pantoate--beta-alanine ligase
MKDYQQVRVIEEMVAQQKNGRRDPAPCHGTRERRLGDEFAKRPAHAEGPADGPFHSKSIKAAQYLFEKGERDAAVIRRKIEQALVKEGLEIDYVALVDATTLQDLPVLDRPALLAMAVFIDGVRLIDNGLLG